MNPTTGSWKRFAAGLGPVVIFSGLVAVGCVDEPATSRGTVPVMAEAATETTADASTVGAAVDPVAAGRATYERYCQSCHGPDGRGDGPVATALTAPPSDLTRLRAEHDGAFPIDVIYRVVDGREAVPAHGSREMPIWGNVWAEDATPDEVQERINELIEYLRTIQEPS